MKIAFMLSFTNSSSEERDQMVHYPTEIIARAGSCFIVNWQLILYTYYKLENLNVILKYSYQ